MKLELFMRSGSGNGDLCIEHAAPVLTYGWMDLVQFKKMADKRRCTFQLQIYFTHMYICLQFTTMCIITFTRVSLTILLSLWIVCNRVQLQSSAVIIISEVISLLLCGRLTLLLHSLLVKGDDSLLLESKMIQWWSIASGN